MRLEIGPVETSPLDAYDRQSVAPLPVGYLAALAIPTELLQQDVFGRMHVERPATAEIDRLAPRQLLSIEGCPSRHEEVDLDLRQLVNRVRVGVGGDCATKRALVDVEIASQAFDQRRYLRVRDARHDIDAYGRTRLTGERTRQ
jgi:hypothetical protein